MNDLMGVESNLLNVSKDRVGLSLKGRTWNFSKFTPNDKKFVILNRVKLTSLFCA